jgi:hypothetical protein
MMLVTETTLSGYFEIVRNSGVFGLLLQFFMTLPVIKRHA